ncbi:hypothetical protein C9374_009033 [Naegleria lovaniensis]|uniref:Ion transport domain-containing protein n=1 Tax=Naegleria lovaniensis TaxID=51637 RepID=A0AA88KEH8_NAELO|nr:uncharacterized protein C9374_009033 [Naegleria lovaniensis]KAG2377517.1 hypothetical protein C9374_009033 [Naegleria lovaniensis]
MFFKRLHSKANSAKHQPLQDDEEASSSPSSSSLSNPSRQQVSNNENHLYKDQSEEFSDELLTVSSPSSLSNRMQSALKVRSSSEDGSNGNGTTKEKRKAVSFRDLKTSHRSVHGEEEESSSNGMNSSRTEMMKSIDDQEQVIIVHDDHTHDDFDTSPNTVNSLQSEYYMTHSGNQRSARDRHSIDEIAMQPKIIMSRQSIRFLKSVIPKKREERTWRHKLYLVMNQPQSSRLATIVTIFVSIVVLMSVIVLILESYATLYQYELMWWIVEGILAFFFSIEYILRMIGTIYTWRDFRDFFLRIMNIVDLLSFMPFYVEVVLYYIFKFTLGESHSITLMVMNLQILGVFRVLRLLKLFTLSKHSIKVKLLLTAMRKSLDLLFSVIFFILSAVFISGTMIYYCERGVYDHTRKEFVHISSDGKTTEISPFSNVLIGMWYSIVTITTTGYGDYVPKSTLGQFVAGCTIVSGLLFVALPSLIIGRTYSEVLHQYELQKAQIDSQMEYTMEDGSSMNDLSSSLFDQQETHEFDHEETWASVIGSGIDEYANDHKGTQGDARTSLDSVRSVSSSSASTTSREAAVKRSTLVDLSSAELTNEEYSQLDQASVFKLLDEQDKLLQETVRRIEKTRRLIALAKRKASIVDD